MKNRILQALVVASVLSPVVAFAQAPQPQTGNTKPTTATYITKEEVDQVLASEGARGGDQNTKIIDLGYENFTVGVSHHGSTRAPRTPAPAGGNAAAAAPSDKCGPQVATLPPNGQPGGDAHKYQTEGYYIISGGGTIFTDGYVLNGRYHSNRGAGGTDGPSCAGMAFDVKKVEVKTGDIIIIPAGVVHGWVDVPDHVDYLSFRPLQNLFDTGWVNPAITK